MYVRVPLEDGGSFVVESADVGQGAVRVARGDRAVATSAETFERSLGTVRQVAQTLVDKISGISVAPDRIRAEFGITLSVESGFVVAKGRGEANFVIELEWSKEAHAHANSSTSPEPGEGPDKPTMP
jgi:hypothetical protein